MTINAIARFERISQRQLSADWERLSLPAPVPEAATLRLPRRATTGSAGYDFFSPLRFALQPGESLLVPTGIRALIQPGWVLLIAPRSSLGFKYRMQLDNTLGIIDSDYAQSDNEGHILIRLTNDGKTGKTLAIEPGASFVQGLFLPFGITTDDDVTALRNGGFGSTGG